MQDLTSARRDSTRHAAPEHERAAIALDRESFRQLGYRAVDLAAEHLSSVRERPVFTPLSQDARSTLLEGAMPEGPLAAEEVFSTIADMITSYPLLNGDPRFFGWVNSPPAPIGVLADLIAAALNASCAGGDHAAIYIEHRAVRWLMELVGFPLEGSMGLLVSGSSMATLTCLTAARHQAAARDGWDVRAEGLQAGRPQFIVYVSSQGHSCLTKAVELLGIGSVNGLRVIPVDEHFRIDMAALRAAIGEDRAAGTRPFCVAASAGTVNTGAIDPLDELADLCAAEGLWLHIDGAYGAVGVLDERVAPLYAGMERADSLALDPHKWLSVPVECGCALVRDGRLLRDTFSLVPPYLRTEEGLGFGGLPWFSEYGLQQTRGFRALKLWATLQQAGRSGLSAMITRHNSLAMQMEALIGEASDLELMAPRTLSIVCFRYVPEALRGDDTALDTLNQAIVTDVQAGGEAFLTGTVLHGRSLLRACILHYATTEDDIATLLNAVRHSGEKRLAVEMERRA